MGLCFSRRKRSDAAVTHNASPRSSFGLSCKSDTVAVPSPRRAHKPNDEIVVVVSEESSSLLVNTQNSHPSRKSKGTKPISAQKTGNASEIAAKGTSNADCEHLPTLQKIGKDLCRSRNGEDCEPSVELTRQQAANKQVAVEDGPAASATANATKQQSFPSEIADPTKKCSSPPPSPPEIAASPPAEINLEDKEMLLAVHDESLTEAKGSNNVLPSSIVKPKRSRSCEETIVLLPEVKRCRGRRSFQDNSTSSPRASQLETISEPLQFGATEFLEGLDLVDVLPHRLSVGENQFGTLSQAEEELKSGRFELTHHKSRGLQADFFALKSRYLSSFGVSPQNAPASYSCPESDDGQVSTHSVNSDTAEDDMMSSFGFMHSRASSLDSAEHVDMVRLHSSSCRHSISVVEEVDENDCGSDESETFEFQHSISIHGGGLNVTKVLCRSRSVPGENETKGSGYCGPNELKEPHLHRQGSPRVKELSVVATGDALLYTGSNSEEFDLIPSKSYVRGSPKRGHTASSDVLPNQDTYYPCQEGLADDDRGKTQPNPLSVDDIILLLEKDELDEEILFSFLNLSKSPAATSHGNMVSSHASDVASEASFEFKIKSPGSTPHSTPSTPMLSAGSTPKRITQLSPLALTSEEIAEIWGVFEQRQALSLSNVYPTQSP